MDRQMIGYRKLSRALVACAIVLLAVQTSVLAQDKAAKIDEVMTAANKYRLFNGSVLVAENGKVIYKKGLGLAQMEWNIPNTADTKFRLGSITKQFTSALILQLVEQGKVKLDSKISEYLPAYRKDIGDKVTVHQLLNHTSGLCPEVTGAPNDGSWEYLFGHTGDPRTVKLAFEPGSACG